MDHDPVGSQSIRISSPAAGPFLFHPGQFGPEAGCGTACGGESLGSGQSPAHVYRGANGRPSQLARLGADFVVGLFDGCRCSRANSHDFRQLVYVVGASSQAPSGRYGSRARIADLRPVLRRGDPDAAKKAPWAAKIELCPGSAPSKCVAPDGGRRREMESGLRSWDVDSHGGTSSTTRPASSGPPSKMPSRMLRGSLL